MTMPRQQVVGKPSALYIYLAVLLLGIFFAQMITSIPHLSMTFDEEGHITVGYSILRTGDFRLVKENPPLIQMWASWPLVLSPQIPAPWQVPGWAEADKDRFTKIWRDVPIDSWVIPARIPIALLALLLGAFLFRWASDWFGPRAGLVALALLAFDPNILAHATIATLDLGVTCLIFIAMYGLERFLRRPSRKNLVLAGMALGLTFAAKTSGLILLPISVGLIFLWGLKHWRKELAVRLCAYLVIAGLTVWAVHLFEFGSRGFSISIPAPSYWRSFLWVRRDVSVDRRWAYLLGETYAGRRWYFYPVVFALKTPLPTLIFLGIALWVAWRCPQRGRREWVLASLPASYLAVTMFSALNMGYRHLLPIVPFMYLSIARVVSPQMEQGALTNRRAWLQRSAILILLVWQAVGTLQTWPFYLTFFNEIGGGPRNGYRYLADSNVDWGQALKALRAYLEARRPDNVRLSNYTFFVRPESYGIQATPLPPSSQAPGILPSRFDPAPGTYVISASTLRGLQLHLTDPEMYNWFWHREPDDLVANAMLVYHVSPRVPPPTWVAQCTTPIPPLGAEQVAEGFGRTDLRLAYFDCAQSWLYPTGGESPGWIVLARDAPTFANSRETAWTGHYLPARLSYEQKRTGFSLPFRIYQDDGHVTGPRGGRVRVAPSAMAPGEAMATSSLELPVTLEGGLTLLGYALDRSALKPGETLHLETAWRVDRVPDRLLSLMAHVLGPGAGAVAVGDGLGVPIESWRPGDVFVQRHTLTLPAGTTLGQYWVQTGVYWLDDGERWPVQDSRAVGDRVMLATLAVHP